MSWSTKPTLVSATIQPNPVNASATYIIAVAVSEVEIIPYVMSPIAGAFASGQSVMLPAHVVQAEE